MGCNNVHVTCVKGWGGVGWEKKHVTCVELEATCMLHGCYGHSKVMLCTSASVSSLVVVTSTSCYASVSYLVLVTHTSCYASVSSLVLTMHESCGGEGWAGVGCGGV